MHDANCFKNRVCITLPVKKKPQFISEEKGVFERPLSSPFVWLEKAMKNSQVRGENNRLAYCLCMKPKPVF